jgi:hypothetical protein
MLIQTSRNRTAERVKLVVLDTELGLGGIMGAIHPHSHIHLPNHNHFQITFAYVVYLYVKLGDNAVTRVWESEHHNIILGSLLLVTFWFSI